MPGAPNRPPEAAAVAPAPSPAPEPPEVRLLRRLVPSHVALLQDLWKGSVPAEVARPFEKAETAFRAGDYSGAASALDQLSIRFAEPRWPTLPEPYRRLRVPIPAPTPPSWDPDHALSAPEKEAAKARRTAEDQLALAEGCVRWAAAHGIASDPFDGAVAAARSALAGPGLPPEFYAAIDGLWRSLRERLPAPKVAGLPSAAAAAAAAVAADEG
jgi:hypothetical protein